MKKILALITAIVMVSQTIVFATPKTEEKEIVFFCVQLPEFEFFTVEKPL